MSRKFTKSITRKTPLSDFGRFGPDTYVVSLQNEICSREILPKYFPKENIIIGVTTYSSDLPDQGR
ncbi:ketopantoate reductase family protein [Paenibacillus beijingensis]|uniref:Ketopantoate reductase N-terminal domain-containing protein n=1 Tax=Paenibacillus beijingensis TaxID=1126833 RepID=A0A0D5NM06_9BACL|nr:2-dehydropantoate 2-reductase N-terminal domain-containing protein [Paenibacillus beijingensis]AJY75968.1 hypothetical protein VN24_17170 [Paenibacillus beijingensis]